MTHITDRPVDTGPPVLPLPGRSVLRRRVLVGAGAVVVLFVGGIVGYRVSRPGRSLMTSAGGATPDLEFVIPAGTADQMAHGVVPDVIPNPLVVHVGDVISVRNDDDAPVLLGPFAIGAGETVVQRFVSAGSLSGVCTVHASGRIEVIVKA